MRSSKGKLDIEQNFIHGMMVGILLTIIILVGAFQLNGRTPHLVKTLYPTGMWLFSIRKITYF
ncbi:MAG: hypothetical protein M0Q53_09270 [Prolixibacteraceae bacterium]|jgi:hypothetical protein|nr:hypothetical protein [Prolixibacteraceae bacterium]